MSDTKPVSTILRAIDFAAKKHRDQRRKGAEASPYINHPIEVAEMLASIGGVVDSAVIQAAILHDTVEDTGTKPEELVSAFGPDVADIVRELTDDKSLPKQERKRLQIEHAPYLSVRAKVIKLADKISNVRSIIDTPPDWPLERRIAYLDWSEKVVAGLRGCNAALESQYDLVLAEGREALGAEVN